MRNLLLAIALLAWFALVVLLSLCRCWPAVVPLLACGGLFEVLAHNARNE